MAKIGKIQLGKQGITKNFLETLKNHFKKYENIKVHILKSSRPEGKKGKEIAKEYSKEILKELGKNYTSKIIGFTINLKKWRKPRVS